jgi:hypothetical protein
VEGLLGESVLKNGFVAKYKFAEGAPDSSLFFLTTDSPKDAQETYNKIKATHIERGNPMREVKDVGDNCLDVLTKYNGRIIIATKGNKIAGGWFLPEDNEVSLIKIMNMLNIEKK